MPVQNQKKLFKPQNEEVTEILFNGEQWWWKENPSILYRNLEEFGKGMLEHGHV